MSTRPPLERIINYMCLMLDELDELTADQVEMAALGEMIDKTEQILAWGRITKKNKDKKPG